MADEFKNRIMRRVYAIWFLRRVAPVVFLEMPLFALIALRETAREFFVAKVMENFAVSLHTGGFSGFLSFTYSALTNAPVVPIAIITFSLGAFAYLAYRIARNFSGMKLVKSY